MNILPIEANDYLKEYMLDYGINVITDRSLPDVRDGLKPVHRRIIYDAFELGLTYDKKFKKSARIVGDVLGKYHPHGDSSVYEALVRLAQDFSMRYPLIDGHGNFGNEDNDSAAAMRYTEAKLQKLSSQILRDINKNTVDFMPNFDGEEQEPMVLPSRFPNLLVNGVNGVAVGFATNMPPHNLSDGIRQIIHQIDNPNCPTSELVDILKAPDFPKGGVIINPKDMLSMYENGVGVVKVRGKYHIEDETNIVFTEIPYQINKAKVVDLINDLSKGYYKQDKSKKKSKPIFINPVIPQIKEVYDESNHIEGMRIIMEVDCKENINLVLKLLFEKTPLQSNFNSLFNVVKGNKLIENISLKQMNNEYIEFQKEVISRRSVFELNKAEVRLNILRGYIIAINNIDRVIEIIKSSESKQQAFVNLTTEFGLNDKQVEAILNMKLSRLMKLEINKIVDEESELNQYVNFLNEVLSNESKLLEVLKQELTEILEMYGDERRTEILYEDELSKVDISTSLIEDYNCRVLLTNTFIKKHLKQSDNHKLSDDDVILCDIPSNNRDTILAFTNLGNRYKIDCHKLKTMTPSSFGQPIKDIINLESGETVIGIVSVSEEIGYMVFAYENGKISKVDIGKYLGNYTKLKNCYNQESKLVSLDYIKKDVDVLCVSNEGKALIFNMEQINSTGSKNSKGNMGIKVEDGKLISCIFDIKDNEFIEVNTEKGKTKMFIMDDIAPTGKRNEERTLFAYINGKRGNKGNYLVNTNATKDKISKVSKSKGE